MSRFLVAAVILACVQRGACAIAEEQGAAGAADQVLSIWPGAPPPWDAPQEEERDTSGPDSRKVAGRPVVRLGLVSRSELHVYLAKGHPTETVVVISPGGGYSILAWDLEGTEIARWLQGIGVTAIVVKYRVPTRASETKWLAAVQDIQRSISLVRSGMIEGVAPQRLGVLGFSAGGNASARVATAARRHYQPIDLADEVGVIPDFAVLIYPAWLNAEGDPNELHPEIRVNQQTPPTFLAVAQDDRKHLMSSVTLFRALTDRHVKSALHVFEQGGHGFGGRMAGQPTDAWQGLCKAWMRDQGWVKP